MLSWLVAEVTSFLLVEFGSSEASFLLELDILLGCLYVLFPSEASLACG
jgi:hypothetical protein